MTKWVFQNKLSQRERERIDSTCAFQPTKELALTTGLPEIAISQAVYDMVSDLYIGRDYVDVYPRGFVMPGETWAGPNLALKYAKQYVTEALGYIEPKDKDLRIACIKSAELLCLHSVFFSEWEGSAESWRLLGLIYLRDWALGDYWLLDGEYEILPSYPKLLKLDFQERAFYCFNKAIALSDIESLNYLGECYLNGYGCDQDSRLANDNFWQAYSRLKDATVRGVGLTTLNIAKCFENGLGCDIDFAAAKDFFDKASQSLSLALDLGEDTLERYLVEAQKGLERMKQELESEPYGFRHGFRNRRYCD